MVHPERVVCGAQIYIFHFCFLRVGTSAVTETVQSKISGSTITYPEVGTSDSQGQQSVNVRNSKIVTQGLGFSTSEVHLVL